MERVDINYVDVAALIGDLKYKVKEFHELDVEYDYYEFEDDEASQMFMTFCARHNIDCEPVLHYCVTDDATGTSVRIPYSTFENSIAEINEDLEGNVPTPITKTFLKQIM